jgi:MoxR-like ATPase
MATQNPIEQEGTFPLPEAQLDRFLMKLTVADPPREVEQQIVKNHATGFDPTDLSRLDAVTTPDEIVAMSRIASRIRVEDAVVGYVVDLVRRTREDRAIELGASPRASIAMMKASQVVAASEGREFVTPDDVKATAKPVLRHRVMLHPDAELQGITADERIDEILKAAPVPRAS